MPHWFSPYWFLPSTLAEFGWGNPYYLYGLIGVPFLFVLRHFFNIRTQQKFKVAFVENTATSQWITYLRFLPPIFGWLAISCLLLALARPQKISKQVERFSEGIDVVLALDVSSSMLTNDIIPNRLEAEKTVALDFIKGRFQDRIGLVAFAGEAFFLSPLTTDYAVLNEYIHDLHEGQIPASGTAIGNAIGRCVNLMRDSDSKTKVAILISDGDNTAGELDPITAAQLAKAYNIKLYTIVVGRMTQRNVSVADTTARNTNLVAVDEALLREIATVSNGQFFRATDALSLRNIFKQINRLERVPIRTNHYLLREDQYHPYLRWAMAFLLGILLLKSTFIGNILED